MFREYLQYYLNYIVTLCNMTKKPRSLKLYIIKMNEKV